MPVQNADNYSNDGHFNLLVYGAPGTGKTRLSLTIPGKPLVISTEPEGHMSLAGNDIDYFVVKTSKDMKEAMKEAENPKYDWVVLDSVSNLSTLYLREQQKVCTDGRQVYGNMAHLVMCNIRDLLAMPKNFYCIARMISSMEENGTTSYAASFEGSKLKSDVPHDFSVVMCLTTVKNKAGKDVLALQTRHDGKYRDLKDRAGALDKYEPAHIGKLLTKIKTHLNKGEKNE